MTPKLNISVCIIVKNEAKNLPKCLRALSGFDEIVILDNESSDESVKVASSFENVRIISSLFLGFGALKRLVVNHAKNDWVLCLDADEVLDFESFLEISKLDFSDEKTIFMLNRKNYYKNEWIKTCGFFPDFLARLFNKNHTNYNDAKVHESVEIKADSKVIKTNIFIHHFAFDNISQFLQKLDKYTEIYAKNSSKNPNVFTPIFHGFFSFFKFYILKRGFCDGFKGFLISIYGGLNSFYKYAKLYEKKRLKYFNLHIFGNDDEIKECLISLKNSKLLPKYIFIYSNNDELLKYSMVDAKLCKKRDFAVLNNEDIFLNAARFEFQTLKNALKNFNKNK